MEAEGFSVVVPTHNRSDLVAELLRTLDVARTNFEGEVEVLVLDSSPGDAAHAINDLCVTHGVRYLQDTNHVGKKRNLGIREALLQIRALHGLGLRGHAGSLQPACPGICIGRRRHRRNPGRDNSLWRHGSDLADLEA